MKLDYGTYLVFGGRHLRNIGEKKTRYRRAASCFVVFCLMTVLFCGSTAVYAYTPVPGTINDGPVRVRSAPVNGTQIGLLYRGTAVTVMDEVSGSDGHVWYQIQAPCNGTTVTGYTRSDFVTLQAAGSVPADDPYVAELKAAGFPDSYCDALAKLHAKYPDWQFVPVQTGLDWNTVIAQESVVGRNLIQSTANDARKSTESTAYDWSSNRWYGFDGNGWVSASGEYIAYCMDPRNFLNENDIFQFETLEYAPYQNAAGVANILADTFMAGDYLDTNGQTYSYADTFVSAGQSLAVSPYHLASRCKQEQGAKGTSPLISGRYAGYEGYYNYFNVGAYTTANASSTVNGLNYARSQGWNSIAGSIAGGSTVIANNYVKKGQNTIYFEKFNVVYQGQLYAHQYMTNVQGAMSEGSSMGKAYTDKGQAFVFRIPVYQNMPASAAALHDTGNPNNWLSSLAVNGYSLTPVFHGATTSYSLVVGADVGTVHVDAVPVAATSQVSGSGDYLLQYGNNVIQVTCVAQNGAARTYTVTVARQQPAVGGGTIAVADGASVTMPYAVGNYVTGIGPGSSAAAVLANIAGNGCTVKILDSSGAEQTGTVGTGNQVAVYVNGAPVRQFEIVVYGDINGDGKISNVDLVLMQKQILGITSQTGAFLEAANVSRDGGVSNKDLVILQKHILGIADIAQ